MEKYIIIAFGGAIGAVARVALGEALSKWDALPYGTMAANIIGCLLIGLIAGLYMAHPEWPQWGKYLLIAGGLGAFTTFSTFILDLLELMTTASLLDSLIYSGLQIGVGLLLCAIGIQIGRLL